jgi:hypothetical protein
VAVATYASLPHLDDDGQRLLSALVGAGVAAEPQVWDDSEVDWHAYDLVLLCSTWDYPMRRGAFVSWVRSLRCVANPSDVVEWNTDKRYLADLAGAPVVPTTFVDGSFVPPDGDYVVKPTVGAAGDGARRFGPGDDAAAAAHVDALRTSGRRVMVQPYMSSVDTAGETSVIFFAGEYSHGAGKGAVLLESEPLPVEEWVLSPREPSPAEVDAARQVLAAMPFDEPPLYARVDLLPGPAGPMLLELELTEPYLFLELNEGSADRFAAAMLNRAVVTESAGPHRR